MSDDYSAGLKEFERLSVKLKSLVDEDPAKAVAEAHALSSDTPVGGVLFTALKAGILVDAGACTGDKPAVTEGVHLFRRLLSHDPEQANLHYNLGNGLIALADEEPYAGFDWYLTTAETRRKARTHFQRAVSLDHRREISSVALTNLGNALWKAHRWAEAYDTYTRALQYDSTNAVAATGAVKVLLRCVKHSIGDREVLLSVAARHLENARQHPSRIAELAGRRAFDDLSKLLQSPLRGGRLPDLSHASDYEKFVASHRLALSPTIEGLDLSLKRWDSLRIESIAEPPGTDFGIPPLFAMFNLLKSDFLVARHLAYQALSTGIPDSGFYSDTLDYAVYGVVPSTLSLAQRACVDVLDKIAVATTEYFGILESEKSVYFTKRWFASRKKGQPLAWHPSLREQIDRGKNTAVIALAELSLDVLEGGSLHEKKAYRHSSTHRFTILHDLGCESSRNSPYVEHCTVDHFKSHLIESLQLSRAALLHFVEMVAIGEGEKKARFGKAVPIDVPSHHWIRGEEESELGSAQLVDRPDS